MNSSKKFENKNGWKREDGEDCMLTCPNLHLNLQTSHFAWFKAKIEWQFKHKHEEDSNKFKALLNNTIQSY